MKIKKAVVLAAGTGSRLSGKFPGTPKPLIKIIDYPLIYYPVKNLYDFGVRNFGIVVNKRTKSIKEKLHEYFEDIKVSLIYQETPVGTARAVLEAEAFVKDDDFLMTYCDNIGSFKFKELCEIFKKSYLLGAVGITRLETNPSTAFASIGGGLIKKIYEKPAIKVSPWKLYPVYIFEKKIFYYLKRVKKSSMGEYDITEGVNMAIESGERFGYIINGDQRINLNTPQDIKKASKYLSGLNL